jgi:flagellar FliL protein
MIRRLPVILALVVLFVAGTGAVFALFGVGGAAGASEDAAAEAPAVAQVFVEVPHITANLTGPGPRPRFLALDLSLAVAGPEDVALVEQLMPRILNSLQPYLRDLSATDLRGSAGLRRVRADLLHRARTAGRPADIEDVLFTEILVQ